MSDEAEVFNDGVAVPPPQIGVSIVEVGPGQKVVVLQALSMNGIQTQLIMPPEMAKQVGAMLMSNADRASSKLEVAGQIPAGLDMLDQLKAR